MKMKLSFFLNLIFPALSFSAFAEDLSSKLCPDPFQTGVQRIEEAVSIGPGTQLPVTVAGKTQLVNFSKIYRDALGRPIAGDVDRSLPMQDDPRFEPFPGVKILTSGPSEEGSAFWHPATRIYFDSLGRTRIFAGYAIFSVTKNFSPTYPFLFSSVERSIDDDTVVLTGAPVILDGNGAKLCFQIAQQGDDPVLGTWTRGRNFGYWPLSHEDFGRITPVTATYLHNCSWARDCRPGAPENSMRQVDLGTMVQLPEIRVGGMRDQVFEFAITRDQEFIIPEYELKDVYLAKVLFQWPTGGEPSSFGIRHAQLGSDPYAICRGHGCDESRDWETRMTLSFKPQIGRSFRFSGDHIFQAVLTRDGVRLNP